MNIYRFDDPSKGHLVSRFANRVFTMFFITPQTPSKRNVLFPFLHRKDNDEYLSIDISERGIFLVPYTHQDTKIGRNGQ